MPQKPKRNQAVLDFIESLKLQLHDSTRNFGLYIKLLKGHGKIKMQEAAKISLKNQAVKDQDKFRYFMGILKKIETPEIKEKSATINRENLDLYEKMRAQLKKKMIPKIQKRASLNSRLAHKVAKEERKRQN